MKVVFVMIKKTFTLLYFLLVLSVPWVVSHPAGTIESVSGTVLWSYVSPVGDPDHHGCVMTWNESNGVKTWLVSEYPASDWFISPGKSGGVYLIERYYHPSQNQHRFRVLKAQAGDEPQVIWDWEADTHRIGEGGFIMRSDEEMLFAAYPYLYRKNKNQNPEVINLPIQDILALRQIEGEKLLIFTEAMAMLFSETFETINIWSNLIEPAGNTPLPFFGNRIFDADVYDSELWVAYWGMRRFDRWINGNEKNTIQQLQSPWLPHGVSVSKLGTFLLASSLDPGFNITPQLLRWQDENLERIWPINPSSVSPFLYHQ